MLEPTEVRRWERLTAAMLQHAADDDPEAFAQVVKVLDDARERLPLVASALRPYVGSDGTQWRRGYSWSDIGRALGISKQAAQQRYGKG